MTYKYIGQVVLINKNHQNLPMNAILKVLLYVLDRHKMTDFNII